MKKIFFTVVICLSPTLGFGSSLPQDLKFDGKPLDAYCIGRIFFGDSSRFEPLDLKQCEKEKQNIVVKPAEESNYFMKKQFIGYAFTSKNDNLSYGLGTPFNYWKYIATTGDREYLIWSEMCGGGTGRFSDLTIIKRVGDYVQNTGIELAGGDRSHGGIVDVEYHAGVLAIKQLATSQEVFKLCLRKLDPHHPLLDKVELPDFSNDWVAVVTTKGTIKDLRVVEIEFVSSFDSLKCDHCDQALLKQFNRIVEQKIKSGNMKLNEDQMKDFAKSVLKGVY